MAVEKDSQRIRWLYSQLETLTRQRVIDSGTAERLRAHYGPVEENRKMAATMIFTAIGFALVGLGIILIIAFNWAGLPRLPKMLLSLLPLLSGIALSLFALKLKRESFAWREGVGAFWFLSIGATISLISQTYNIHGELQGFLLIWIVLGLPVIYVMLSSFAYFLVMAWVLWWASLAQLDGGYATAFWLLMAAALPFLVMKFREDRYSGGVIRNSLLTAITFSVGVGVSLEKCLPGLWIVIYMALFAVMYLSSGKLYSERESVLRRPFQWYSVSAITVLSLVLTLEWPWEEIGWRYYRTGGKFFALAGVADYLLLGALLAASAALLVDALRRRKYWLIDFGLAPFLALACYLIMTIAGNTYESVALISVQISMNLYCLYLGIRAIVAGLELREMTVVNGGMLTLGVLVIMRFFDLDFGLLERGITFILVGAAILAANILLNKKTGVKNV